MVLRELERRACFAWFQGTTSLLVTGTKSGTTKSNATDQFKLELWDLGFDQLDAPSDLNPIGVITTDSGFNDLAWSQSNDEHPLGVIAGALENGHVDLWDAEKLRNGASDALISRISEHSGSVKALQWDPHNSSQLATAGPKAEVFIHIIKGDAVKSSKLGLEKSPVTGTFECLDWSQRRVGSQNAHILGVGSSDGFVAVWMLSEEQKLVTTLNTKVAHNNKEVAVSAIAWDPEESTRLATATSADSEPLISMWRLRNQKEPELTLTGHGTGVLGLSWCVQDAELLLSCGEDSRTICWNSKNGERYGDVFVGSKSTFQTKWNPHNPNLIASASQDAKILVTTTQNIKQKSAEQTQAAQPQDPDDFFETPHKQLETTYFAIPKAPSWTARRSNVSFGFGGKLVTVTTATTRSSKISLHTVSSDSDLGDAAAKFQEKLRSGDVESICTAKIEAATTEEEKADWQIIQTLNAGKSRKKLREYLGFADQAVEDAEKTASPTVNGEAGSKAQTNGNNTDDDFFSGEHNDDDFLLDLASSKDKKADSPFSIYTGSESEADKNITHALMLGQFEKALDICLEPPNERLADAFMIAVCGGQSCIDKAQAAYLKKKAKDANGPNYLRLLASIVGKNLWDVVHNADLRNWKDVMATLCTYADGAEFSDLCEALGDRLEEAFQKDSSTKSLRADASFCYLAGSKLEKVVINWVQELAESEKAALDASIESDSAGAGDASTKENGFSIHARCLQDFVEKVSVFRRVTNFQDPQMDAKKDWKLASLYRLYTEYADILASHGQLGLAEQYLALLPSQYEGAETAQQRITQATQNTANTTRKPLASTAARTPAATAPAVQPMMAPTQPLINQARNAPGPYAPQASPQQNPGPGRLYAPVGAPGPSNNAYTPSGYQPPSGNPYGQSTYNTYQSPPQQAAIPPPPRMGTASPAMLPAAATKPAGNWNDMPHDFLKDRQPNSRRGTPGPQPVSSPFPNAAPVPTPSAPQNPYGQPRPSAPLAPPPKAGEMAQRIASPPTVQPPPTDARPPSTRGYMPSQTPPAPYSPAHPPTSSTLPAPVVPPLARGTSPYQPPPSTSTAPTSNRYAPAPGSQPSQGPGTGPYQQRQVAPNPYATQGQGAYPPSRPNQATPYGQPVAAAPSAAVGPPPRAGPPPSGPPRSQQSTPVAPPPSGPARRPPPAANTSAPPLPQSAADARAEPASSATSPEALSEYPNIPEEVRVEVAKLLTALFQIKKDEVHVEQELVDAKKAQPGKVGPQILDIPKRLRFLYGDLNRHALGHTNVSAVVSFSKAVGAHDWDRAEICFADIQAESMYEKWAPGIKRIVTFGRVTNWNA